ncbi:MAG: ABC transporter permease [Helicobacter sp.]|nr:ABC transporter permease [Helicobacter sp.]
MSKNTQFFRIYQTLEQGKTKEQSKTNAIVELLGIWDYQISKNVLKALEKRLVALENIILDFEKITSIDFPTLCFILINAKNAKIQHANKSILTQIEAFNKFYSPDPISPSNAPQKNQKSALSVLAQIPSFIAARTKAFYEDLLDFLNFFGLVIYHFYLSIKEPKKLNVKSFIFHMHESGFKAMPVALLTTFIIGFAITLQGAIQLQKFGAPLLSVDTTAKLALREIGPFILALVIAGRSSSSFTAELSSMGVTEELQAMRAMDFNIFYFLVIPRVLALMIVMPLLVFLSDIVSIFAGMVALKLELGFSFEQYLERFYEVVGWNNFLVGILKAPFFGATIALVGTFRGLGDVKDTQMLGQNVIKSVINALFWIIVIDAIASIIFTRILV